MTWLTIRNAVRLKSVNTAYGLLIGIPLLVQVFEAAQHSGTVTATLPWTVKAVYAASLLFIVAVVIYHLACPRDVKRYESLEAYIAALREPLERSSPDKKVAIILSNLENNQGALRAELADLAAGAQSQASQRRLAEIVELMYSSCVQRHLVKRWYRDLTASPVLRWLVLSLYLLSAGLTLAVIVQRGLVVWRA
jgi:hypothetical protein